MAITFDAASSANGTASPLTWSHTVASGDNRMLIVGVSIRKESDPRPTVTGVTYDGDAMTQAVTRANDGKTSSDIWYLPNPSVGTANISVTMSSTPTNVVGGAVSYQGIDLADPLIRTGTNNGTNNAPTITIVAEVGALAVDVVSSVTGITVAGSQTQRWTDANSFLNGRGGTFDGVGGPVTLNWTMGSGQLWTIAAAVFRAHVPETVVSDVSGGAIKLIPELWTATRDNAFQENITDILVEGIVDMNVDRDIAGSCTIKVRDPDRIRPFVDYLAPRIRQTYEDGREDDFRQLGLYSVKIPPGDFTVEMATATYVGSDLTSTLALTTLTDTWNIAASTNIRTAIIALLAHAGLTRYVLPESSVTLTNALSFQIGTTVLQAVNILCEMLGWYHVAANLEGFIVSAGEIRELSALSPFATFTSADIRSPVFSVNPSDLQIVNVVVCVNTNNAAAPLVSIARNDDPDSPTSTVTLGRELSYPGGSIQVAGEISQARLDMIARQYLREGRSYYRTGSFSVLPRADGLIPQQTVDLDLDGELAAFSGRWYVRTARMGVRPNDALLTIEVNQTTSFTGAPI